MASTSVAWTPSSSGNRNKWTWSGWVKRSSLGEQVIFGCYQNGSYATELKFSTSDEIHFEDTYNTNTNGRIITTAKFRDTSAWYHIVAVFDNAAGSTAADKIKVYVNGVNQAGAYGNAPTNATTLNSSGQKIQHGQLGAGSNFDGLMSHCHFCDGYAYQASDFGETDSTTGEWKIKTSPSVSYGTNGFWILKDGNSVTDQSPNSNNFTVEAGTLTNTEDNPSNVFCTMNPLDYNSTTISEGSNRIAWSQSAGNFAITTGTIGMTTGKYYWEAKVTSDDNSTGIHLGVLQTEPYISRTTSPTVNTSLFYGLGIRLATNKSVYRTSNGTDSSISDTWSNNSVIRIAYDGDAGKIYMWKDATEFNGQTFSSNTSFNSATLTAGTMVLPFIGFGDGGSGTKNAHANFNFGNGYFGSTAVSSAGTNASGNGIFEYDVPTGYTALSTKGLNE